jgi:hypothetical protein
MINPPTAIKIQKIVHENTLCRFCAKIDKCKMHEDSLETGLGKKGKLEVTYKRIIVGCSAYESKT